MSTEEVSRAVILAASYPPREYKSRANSHEIAAAIKALAGSVFQQGWKLVFGGHPAVSPLILMIAREYGRKDQVVIFQSDYFFHHISPSTRALTEEAYGRIVFVTRDPAETPPPPGEPIDPSQCPKSLTAMRFQMMNHPGVSALVLIGGDTGLRQELDLFARVHEKLPILPIGAPGGIAEELTGEARTMGMDLSLSRSLSTSRNYLTLCTAIMSNLISRP